VPLENATILILARNTELQQTLSSIKSLEEHWNYRYPIVFLNDEPWDPAFEHAVREATSSPTVTFAQIPKEMWSWPVEVDLDQAAIRRKWKAMERQGLPHAADESYHHMCR